MMLVHGEQDTVVFIDSTAAFVKSTHAAATNVTDLRVEDAGHAAMGQKGRQTTPAMHAFFARHLATMPSE